MRMGNMNGPGNRADVLTGEMDESRGQVDGTTGEMDTSNVSNRAETAGISSGEGVGTYLEAGGMKCIIDATEEWADGAVSPSGMVGPWIWCHCAICNGRVEIWHDITSCNTVIRAIEQREML